MNETRKMTYSNLNTQVKYSVCFCLFSASINRKRILVIFLRSANFRELATHGFVFILIFICATAVCFVLFSGSCWPVCVSWRDSWRNSWPKLDFEHVEAPISNIEDQEWDGEDDSGILVNDVNIFDAWQGGLQRRSAFFELTQKSGLAGFFQRRTGSGSWPA